MPASIKLKEQYGDDVAVLFVESQATPPDDTERFILKQKKWSASAAMWTHERPMTAPGEGLPACVLLGADGRVLLKGNPLSMSSKIDETVAAEVKAAKSAPKGSSAEVAKAWGEFAKGRIAAAIAIADQAVTDGKDATGAKAASDEFKRRAGVRVARLKWMVDNGEYARADAEAAALSKSVEGVGDLSKTVADCAARLSSDGLKPAREAAKALAAFEAKMAEKGPDDGSSKALTKLAEKYPGTKAAERATHLAQLLAK